MTPVESIWTTARARHGDPQDRKTPTPGFVDVLLDLAYKGSDFGHSIARRTGLDQGNTSRALRKLARFGFVMAGEIVPAGDVRKTGAGGRDAVFWELTRAGRELVEALVAEEMAA